MSRTDAHTPYWAQAVWYESVHHLYCPFYLHRSWLSRTPRQPCNLPERPVRHAGSRTRLYVPLCTWEPVWPNWRSSQKYYGSRVPRWYRHHIWFEPERTQERDILGEMAKEYNALGELDDGDFPNHQHRHGAKWYWD